MFGALSQSEQTRQPSMSTATMEEAASAIMLGDYGGAGSKGAKELLELCANKKLLDLKVDMNSCEEHQLGKIANAWNAWMDQSTSNLTSNEAHPFT
jgi:hypothetical protein